MKFAAGIEDVRGVVSPTARSASPGIGAGTVLAVGTWIGLLAGFCDVGILVVSTRFIRRDFYRLGGDFPWIVPTAVAFIVLVPASLIALRSRIRGPVPLAVPVGLLSFIAFLELICRLRLQVWAVVILSGGLSIQSARLVRPRRDGFLRLVRWTIGLLVAVLFATATSTIGGRLWSEYRQASSRPAAPAGARNVLLIVWDTVRAANTSLY